jgi:hypothetical protein
MKNYYTTLQLSGSSYIGEVYDRSNNQLLFTTKPHNTQRQAMQEMDFFIDGTITNDVGTAVKTETPIEYLPKPITANRRCCGR